MNQKHVLIALGSFAIGITVCYLYMRNKAAASEILKKGDKGKNVLALQKIINAVVPEPILEENGLYSNEVQKQVDAILSPVSIYKNGNVDKGFFNNLAEIYDLRKQM